MTEAAASAMIQNIGRHLRHFASIAKQAELKVFQ
jgi:hypothetical protein